MLKVMLVDDEPFIRKGLRIIVDWEKYGFEIVAEAENGVEAIRILEELKVDLVIVDLRMPEMSGLELIEYVRKSISKKIGFVILTGYADFEYAKAALQLDVKDYLLKPVQEKEIIEMLEQIRLAYQKEKRHERITYDLHIAQIILDKYTKEDIDYVKQWLPDFKNWKYLSFEFNKKQKEFQELNHSQKVQLQKNCMEYLQSLMKTNVYHVVQLLEQEEGIFGVGVLFTEELAAENQMGEVEYFSYIQKRVNQRFSCGVQVYVGSLVESIDLIAESFQSIRVARCLHNLTEDKNPVMTYEATRKRKTAMGVGQAEVDELIESVKNNNEYRICQIIHTIFMQIRNHDMNMDMINASIYFILYRLMELAKEFDSELNQQEVLRYISRESFNNIVLSGSADEFTRFVLEYAEYLEQVRNIETKGVLEQVEDYVYSNYTENLSLKTLGQKFYINNVYLGQLFKKKYGISFKEYMNQLRIDEAVNKLETTNLQIYAIAEHVGFHNVDYFINKFVKLKGITPLQYRIKNK